MSPGALRYEGSDYQDQTHPWILEIRRSIKEKREKTYHESTSKLRYEPLYTDNLETVECAGPAVLKGAKKLHSVRAYGLGLYRSIVSKGVFVWSGSARIIQSDTPQLLFSGRKIVVKDCKIEEFKVTTNNSKQVVEIFNSSIKRLQIIRDKVSLPMPSICNKNLDYKSSDGTFLLKIKNVNIESIIIEEFSKGE